MVTIRCPSKCYIEIMKSYRKFTNIFYSIHYTYVEITTGHIGYEKFIGVIAWDILA